MDIFIREAAGRGIVLNPGDFTYEPGMGGWTLDGMVPEEWLDTMTDTEPTMGNCPGGGDHVPGGSGEWAGRCVKCGQPC